MRRRLTWFVHLRAQSPKEVAMSTPSTLLTPYFFLRLRSGQMSGEGTNVLNSRRTRLPRFPGRIRGDRGAVFGVQERRRAGVVFDADAPCGWIKKLLCSASTVCRPSQPVGTTSAIFDESRAETMVLSHQRRDDGTVASAR